MRNLIIATILAAIPMAVWAEEDTPQDIALEARKGFFQMLGANMGTLAGMAKGEVAYDEAAAVTAASNIEALSKYTVPMHFIDGTSTKEMPDETEALPEIWSDNAGFTAKFAALGEAAAGAGEAVKGGQDKVGPVVQKLGGACKGCHDTYRKK